MKKLTNEQFIEKAREVHGDKYSYELVDYKDCRTKVKILCKQHGSFEQMPSKHLSGQGCASCTGNAAKASKAKSEFANKASIIHNYKYDYSLVDYKTKKIKVKIICKHHGIFEQQPHAHLSGQGCAKCGVVESGWTRTHFKVKCEKNNESKGILYILECFNDNERFIKIGITSLSVKTRYASTRDMPYNYRVLYELVADPEVIYDLETLLHRKSCNYKYKPTTSFGGHATECFEADPTYLDKLNTYINQLNNIQIRSNYE